MEKGTLYIVATPIGNLDDITLRAIKTLQEADLIAAEDTRHTLKLLNHLEISKPMISYHRHNEETKSNVLIEKLQETKTGEIHVNPDSRSRIPFQLGTLYIPFGKRLPEPSERNPHARKNAPPL